jgi:hypothetical protein
MAPDGGGEIQKKSRSWVLTAVKDVLFLRFWTIAINTSLRTGKWSPEYRD